MAPQAATCYATRTVSKKTNFTNNGLWYPARCVQEQALHDRRKKLRTFSWINLQFIKMH